MQLMQALRLGMRSAGVGPAVWTPGSLFASGEQGVWYDPSDFERYIVRGADVVVDPNIDDATKWTFTQPTSGSVSVTGSALRINSVDGSYAAAIPAPGTNVVVGRMYEYEITITAITGSIAVSIGAAASANLSAVGSYRGIITATQTDAALVKRGSACDAIISRFQYRELSADTATMYQDSAGTTPVTAVEQPVGLILDKRLGAVRGNDLIPDPGFDTPASWSFSQPTAGSVTVAGGVLTLNSTDGSLAVAYPTAAVTVAAGAAYEYVITVSGISAGVVTVMIGGTQGVNISAAGTYRGIVTAINSNKPEVKRATGGVATTAVVTSYSVKPILGNHASQATAAARPLLSARVNMLTKSEQFDDAVWIKSASGTGVIPVVTANYGTDPWGGNTADRIQLDSGAAGNSQVAQAVPTIPVGTATTYSIWLRSLTGPVAVTLFSQNTAPSVNVTAQWQRFEIPIASGTGVATDVRIAKRDTWSTTGVADLLVAGGQFEYGSAATRYQRVNTATDYDSVGFPYYLKFDGVDDGLVTNSVDFSGTNKMSVFTGVHKASDAAVGCLVELGNSGTPDLGSFAIFAPVVAAQNSFSIRSVGSFTVTANVIGAAYAAPTTRVLTMSSDISGDAVTPRVDGVQQATNNTDQGTGNYGNYLLNIGKRAGTTIPLNGRIYSLIVRGAATGAFTIPSVERYVAAKTGVTLP